MLQRIGIAQAVIADPVLVILDEPTSALDPIGRRDVRDLIRAPPRARASPSSSTPTCSPRWRSVCDRVAIIDHGMVVRQGALRDLVAGALEAEVRLDALPPALLIALGERWPAVPSSAPDGAGCGRCA